MKTMNRLLQIGLKTTCGVLLAINAFSYTGNGSLGTNLNGVGSNSQSEYHTIPIFKNLARMAGGWAKLSPWTALTSSQLTSEGIPKLGSYGGVEVGVKIISNGGKYRAGTYHVYYSGSANWDARWEGSNLVEVSEGHLTFTATPSLNVGGVLLVIKSMTTQVTNIRIVHQNFISNYTSDPWDPEFINDINDFSVLRYMMWQRINSSNVTTWSDSYYNGVKFSGEPNIKEMIALANKQGAHMWVCIPHKADDNYVTQLAARIGNDLNSGLKVYVEYSNETWNSASGFSQSSYVITKGNEIFPGQGISDYDRGMMYTAARARTIHNIFEANAKLGDARVVRVVAHQAANGSNCGRILDHYKNLNNNVKAEALAVAPYFGGGDWVDDEVTTSQGIIDWYYNENKTYGNAKQTRGWMDACSTAAHNRAVPLIGYEGGQHWVSKNKSQASLDRIYAANRDADLYWVYRNYLDAWKYRANENGGGLMCMFASGGRYDHNGCWGHRENMFKAKTQADSPKWKAMIDWTADNPKWWSVTAREEVSDNGLLSAVVSDNQGINMYPNPSENEDVTISIAEGDSAQIEIFNLQGNKVYEAVSSGSYKLKSSTLAAGQYMVIVKCNGISKRSKLVLL